MRNEVFQHLTDEEVMEKYNEFIAQGMDEDDAFNEVYSIDCNMDEEQEYC